MSTTVLNDNRNGNTRTKRHQNDQRIQRSQSGLLQPLNWHDNITPTDIHVPWLYEAHSLILLCVVLSVIFYFTFTTKGSPQLGFGLVIFFFIAVGCLVFPAGPFMRPHPIFWRLVFSISLLYACFLLYLLAQEPDDARATLRTLFADETLGIKQPERSYAEDCSLTWDSVVGVCDRFLIAHLLGWAIKALIMRDRMLCWIVSVLWEIIELATKYFIPNFAECWWDQLILDVILCNGLGIELGLFLIGKWFDTDPRKAPRDWLGRGLYDPRATWVRFKRLFIQFTPTSISPMYWEPLSSITRFFQIHLFIICACLWEFNAFTLKLFLYIPTEHPLNIWRIVLFTMFFVVCAKQYYLYLTNEKCKKLGSQTWVVFVIVVLEVALTYKCAPTPFPAMPYFNKVCWQIAGVAWLILTFVCFRDLSHVKAD